MSNKYLVIHGHFYQPPRENPWLDKIELQSSAFPNHDWNDRITEECYMPNAFSKIYDANGKILKLVNNYTKINFNFGPTLLSWLEKFKSSTYKAILKADKISIKNNNGHGNAIAQVYNHIIMPLANNEDKETQIKWGIYDFKKRFKRFPEGMWLAETAVNYETIECLIENDISYTILSPYQASKIRKIGEGNFQDVLGGKINILRPYRCFSKKNPKKYIDIFFYNGPIANSISFEEILSNSTKFLNTLKNGFDYNDSNSPQIMNIATDGEVYGHHKKFADLTLAHLLFELAEKNDIKTTNYGNYLNMFKPEYEVIINEGDGSGTAWSCAHGVERWRSDCGCNTGYNNGWNQKWRTPLRNGLNDLRDELSLLYKKEGEKYFINPSKARNSYISIIMDRSEKQLKTFFEENSKYPLNEQNQTNALKLLELSRNSLLMFTSCGWFFDEISGIEPQQILRYALRAIQLANDFNPNNNFEEKLTATLSQAKSNIKDLGTGKDIFIKNIKNEITDFYKIASQYSILSLFKTFPKTDILYKYKINRKKFLKFNKSNIDLALGEVEIKDLETFEKATLIFAVLKFGMLDFRCSAKISRDDKEYDELEKQLLEEIGEYFSIVELIRAIDQHISCDYYTINNLLIEEKDEIMKKITEEFFLEYRKTYEKIYRDSLDVIEILANLGEEIPDEFRIAAEYTISAQIYDRIEEFEKFKDFNCAISEITVLINRYKKIKQKFDNKKVIRNIKNIFFNHVKVIEELTDKDLEFIIQFLQIVELLDIKIINNFIENKLYHVINSSSDLDKKLVSKLFKILNFSFG